MSPKFSNEIKENWTLKTFKVLFPALSFHSRSKINAISFHVVKINYKFIENFQIFYRSGESNFRSIIDIFSEFVFARM